MQADVDRDQSNDKESNINKTFTCDIITFANSSVLHDQFFTTPALEEFDM